MVDFFQSWQSALAPRISESTETIEMGPLLEQSQKPVSFHHHSTA